MIVDDEPSIVDTLAIIFRQSGYDVRTYTDPRSALQACAAEPPHLLLSDVVMPGINGIDLALLVQERCPGCRVLLISGIGASLELLESARRNGHAFEILEKPVPPVVLLQKVRTVLHYDSLLQFPKNRVRSRSAPRQNSKESA